MLISGGGVSAVTGGMATFTVEDWRDGMGVAEGVETVKWDVLEEETVSAAIGLKSSLLLSCGWVKGSY